MDKDSFEHIFLRFGPHHFWSWICEAVSSQIHVWTLHWTRNLLNTFLLDFKTSTLDAWASPRHTFLKQNSLGRQHLNRVTDFKASTLDAWALPRHTFFKKNSLGWQRFNRVTDFKASTLDAWASPRHIFLKQNSLGRQHLNRVTDFKASTLEPWASPRQCLGFAHAYFFKTELLRKTTLE